MNLQLTMTLGDVIVAASVVTTIIGAYFAMKGQIAQMHRDLMGVIERVDDHDSVLSVHGEGLAALDAAVFGRRRNDALHPSSHRNRRRTEPKEGEPT